jgi:hypothetical protein
MQVHISPSMRRITISASPGFLDPMRMKGAARYLSYRCLFWTMLLLVFLLPFLFITTALVTLEGVNKCSSLGTLHRHHAFPDFTPPPRLHCLCFSLMSSPSLLTHQHILHLGTGTHDNQIRIQVLLRRTVPEERASE